MLDSACEDHATSFDSSYALRQAVVLPALERGMPPAIGRYTDLNEARSPYPRMTIRAADQFVQVSPSDAVSRRTASWPGMAVEIVQASRRGRIDYQYCAPVHMLAV